LKYGELFILFVYQSLLADKILFIYRYYRYLLLFFWFYCWWL